MWDAAFTIQSAHRRMHVRRRRRARALKRAMGASNAAAAWNQGLEHARETTETAAAGTGGGGLDSGNGNDDVEGLANSRGRVGGRNDRGEVGSATGASPPAHGGDNTTTTVSGVANTIHTTGNEGNRPGGQGPTSAAAPTEPEFEDLGDVASAAVRLAKNPPPTPMPSPPIPAPVEAVREPACGAQTVVEAKPVSAAPPPAQEETLEYYEAKMRYLEAQEKAHGASACKIQVSK